MQLSTLTHSPNATSLFASAGRKTAALPVYSPASPGDQVLFQGRLNRLKGKASDKINGWQQVTSFFAGGDDSPGGRHFKKALNHAVSWADAEKNRRVEFGYGSSLQGSDKPNAKKAESELRKAARRGENMAVAKVYAKGFGVIQPDASKTRTYLERAAYQGGWDPLKAAIHLARGFGPMQADPKTARRILNDVCSKQPNLMPYVIRVYEQGLGEVAPDPTRVAAVRSSLIESYEKRVNNPEAPLLTSGEILEVIRSYAQSDATVDKATAMLEEIIEHETATEQGGAIYSESFLDEIFSDLSDSERSDTRIIEVLKLVAAGEGKMKADPERADKLAGKLYSNSRSWDVLLQLANLLRTGHGELAPHPGAVMQILHEFVDASMEKFQDTPKEALEAAARTYKLPPEIVDFYLENTVQFPPEDRLF